MELENLRGRGILRSELHHFHLLSPQYGREQGHRRNESIHTNHLKNLLLAAQINCAAVHVNMQHRTASIEGALSQHGARSRLASGLDANLLKIGNNPARSAARIVPGQNRQRNVRRNEHRDVTSVSTKRGILYSISRKQFRHYASRGGGSPQSSPHIAETDGSRGGFAANTIRGIHLDGAGGTFGRHGSI